MSKRRSVGFFLVLALLLVAQPVVADQDRYFGHPDTGMAALGGVHAAYTSGSSVMRANPAGLGSTEPRVDLIGLQTRLTGPVFSIFGAALNTVNGGDLLTSIQPLLADLYANIEFAGPIGFAYVGNGLGFGVYNNSYAEVVRTGTELAVYAGDSLQFYGGFSFPIFSAPDSGLSLQSGLLLKAFVNGESRLAVNALDVAALNDTISSLPTGLLDEPFYLTSGFSFDIGFLFAWHDFLAVAITGQDVYGPTLTNVYGSILDVSSGVAPVSDSSGLLPQNLSVGARVTPPLGVLGVVMDRLDIYIDYRDIIDFVVSPAAAVNPVLKLLVGAEITMFEVLRVRGGFGQGLFSTGLGLDLGLLELQGAMYGSELTGEPGLRPQYNLELALLVRL